MTAGFWQRDTWLYGCSLSLQRQEIDMLGSFIYSIMNIYQEPSMCQALC